MGKDGVVEMPWRALGCRWVWHRSHLKDGHRRSVGNGRLPGEGQKDQLTIQAVVSLGKSLGLLKPQCCHLQNGVLNVTDVRGVSNCGGNVRRVTSGAQLVTHEMSGLWRLPPPGPSSVDSRNPNFTGGALLLSGLPLRATILGLGFLPNLTLEAVNLAVALGTGPLALAFRASA